MDRLLIVEDYEAIADIERLVATMEGFSVRIARTSGEALALATEFRPDAIVLDLALGDGDDGEEVLRRLREHGDSTPVVVVSARTGLRDSEIAGYENVMLLPKPFKSHELAEHLRSLRNRSKT